MERELERAEFLDRVRSSDLYESRIVEGKIEQTTCRQEDWEPVKDHFKTLFYDIFGGKGREKKKIKDYSASNIFRYYSNVQLLKRVFLKKDNIYIVKKFFTEGVQYVPEGEVHEYEILGIRPIDFFELYDEHPIHSFNDSFSKIIDANRALKSKTFIESNTYYFIVAPYHTSFIKTIKKSDSTSAEGPRLEIYQNPALGEAQEELPSLPGPSNVSERRSSAISSSSMEESGDSSNYVGIGGDSTQKRSSEEPENHSKRRKSNNQSSKNLVSRQPDESVTNMSLLSLDQVNELSQSMFLDVSVNDQESIGTGNPSVFGIRKNNYIESYHLEPDSTFQILPDGSLSGMFKIKNDDIDPYVIHYICDEQTICEKSFFRNGSVFETPLKVHRDFMEYLQIPGNIGKEKRVVRYFYNYVFRKIEIVYKKFVEMQNTGMIGSCVPAIVQLDNTRFTGFLADIYKRSDEDSKNTRRLLLEYSSNF